MDKGKFRDEVIRLLEIHNNELTETSDYIFNNPELGEREYKSCCYLQETLAKHGFTIDKPCESLPTAFVAEYGEGDTVIAFVAEYDALPGILKNGAPAHACGHNWIAAAMCCCGIILSELKKVIPCRIKVIGTPAEETIGRKIDFLVQEFNREANTIGSKCQNSDIAHVVVDLKSDIEKIREQIQNIE